MQCRVSYFSKKNIIIYFLVLFQPVRKRVELEFNGEREFKISSVVIKIRKDSTLIGYDSPNESVSKTVIK